jgi:hypothetical protein
MQIGGWKTRSVFERYNIITQTDIKDAMTKLQASEKTVKQEQGSDFGDVLDHVDAARKSRTVN